MRRTLTIIVKCAMAALLPAPVLAQGSGETIVVTSIEKTGESTLRQALRDAQNGDTITFDPSVFPPDAPATITLTRELPQVLQGNLTIDASDAGVILDGGGITTPEAVGLSVSSNSNIIRGIQFVDFSLAGIRLNGGAQNNTIGGDRHVGAGPSGQGNMVTGSGTFGIALWSEGTSFNTIRGNVIGTDPGGTTRLADFSGGIFSDGAGDNLVVDNLIGGYVDNGVRLGGVRGGHNTVRGNHIGTDASGAIQLTYGSSIGISIDNSGNNVVGPSNVIAHNGHSGIIVEGVRSMGNRITQNSIYSNGALGIELARGGNARSAAPALLDFNMHAGTVSGVACAHCTVELFSDNADQGEVYEGTTTANNVGFFTLTGGASFTQSHLTATATDANGNTSQFSVFTPDVASRNAILQEGNDLQRSLLRPKRSEDLENNRIGIHWDLVGPGNSALEWNERMVYDLGIKHASLLFNSKEWHTARWDWPELTISQAQDDHVSDLVAHGLTLNLNLVFWDTANHPDGWEEPEGYSRFQSEAEDQQRYEEEIRRYTEYVQSMVRQFKDRIQYYELWNEPDNGGFRVQHIRAQDYIELVKRVAPAIREEYPEAKIVIGSVVFQESQDYMFRLVNSREIMPLVDVLSWHPFYGTTPADDHARDYWYDYPGIVQGIRDTARANGFTGELQAEELSWWSATNPPQDMPWGLVSPRQSIKYQLRGTMLHLGMDMKAIISTPGYENRITFTTMHNLCTVMAGTTTGDFPMHIQSEAADLRRYGFALPGDDRMIALWTDGVAVDDDPGVAATLILPGLSDRTAMGIDVLNGFEQELITEVDNGSLVIRDLMVKDYPIIVTITSDAATAIETATGAVPVTSALQQNYPNPFNPQTTIHYTLERAAPTSLEIYDVLGQSVRTLVDGTQPQGRHTVQWDGKDRRGREVASGVYFYRLVTVGHVKARRMVLIR